MEFPSTLDEFLILGYVVFCMGLNVVAFLISAFYKKKINRNAPYIGFLLSLLLGAVFVGTYVITGDEVYVGIVRTTALLGCSMSSTFSMTALFLSMSKRR
jgi:4-hydroxybenzoate polyprenyltransferase